MAAQSNKIKQFYSSRQTASSKLEQLAIFADNASQDETHLIQFKIRYEQIDNIYEEFYKNHNALIALLSLTENPNLEVEESIRKMFDDRYFLIRTTYHGLFNKDIKPETDQCKVFHQTNLQLPKIDLPKFYGDYSEWPAFIDLFKSLVHLNSSVPKIQKFQYLQLSLGKEPLSLIKSLNLSEDNYDIAYKSLVNRYENVRLLSSSCWQQITDLPKLTSETPVELRTLLNVFNENLEALRNLGLPVDSWDFVLFHIAIAKLDMSTLKRFELEHSSTNIPTFESLKTFLEKQCVALESIAFTTQKSDKKSFSSHSSKEKFVRNKKSFFTISSKSNFNNSQNASY